MLKKILPIVWIEKKTKLSTTLHFYELTKSLFTHGGRIISKGDLLWKDLKQKNAKLSMNCNIFENAETIQIFH